MAQRKAENLLNYRTRVEAGETAAEILGLLSGKKAVSINLDYEDGKVSAITFVLRIGDNLVPFRLQPNIVGVNRKINQGMRQAERVAWRIVLRWVEAQIALVESNQAEMGQVFLPYAVRGDGESMWHAFQQSNTKQIGSGQ